MPDTRLTDFGEVPNSLSDLERQLNAVRNYESFEINVYEASGRKPVAPVVDRYDELDDAFLSSTISAQAHVGFRSDITVRIVTMVIQSP